MAAGSPAPARFGSAIAANARANSEDPEQLDPDGSGPRPKELVHAEMVTDWVRRLDPGAEEVQLLAARAHHFRRWTHPRSDHPEGRAGYLRWRAEAKRRQAEEVGELLRSQGYDDTTAQRVGQIVRKERRSEDPQVQVHERLGRTRAEEPIGDVFASRSTSCWAASSRSPPKRSRNSGSAAW